MEDLAVLQFLMLILTLTALILGAIIGERRKVEQQLADEEDRLRLILESAAEGIYGIDRYGVCMFINQAALRILGFPSRDQGIITSCCSTPSVSSFVIRSRRPGIPFPGMFPACRQGRTLFR